MFIHLPAFELPRVMTSFEPNVKSVWHRQTVQTQNAAYDQGLHSLLIEWSIKIRMKMKNITQQHLKRKWGQWLETDRLAQTVQNF